MRRWAAPIAAMNLLILAGCSSHTSRPASVPAVAPPTSGRAVETARYELLDPARGRAVPVKVYAPRGEGLFPLVLFSHGMGESRDSYDYLGEEWASRGYLAIHLTHAGSDSEEKKKGFLALFRATRNSETWRNRPLDVSFVISELEKGSSLPIAGGRADLSRIAVAGHSAGAFTALALSGLTIDGDKRMRDSRVKAAIAMSMPEMGDVLEHENAYSRIEVPVLHVTGTRDYSILSRTFPSERRLPFERTKASDQYLVTIFGATHSTFSNQERAELKRDFRLHQHVRRVTSSFLDAYLKGDSPSLQALRKERLMTGGDEVARIERK